MSGLEFTASAPFTFGVELELQVVNRRDFDLTSSAPDLLRLVERQHPPGEVKPEITQSMLEISTSVHRQHGSMLAELRTMRDVVSRQAERLNLGVAGGGTHPFQRWSERRIYGAPRFHHLSDLYGYLAKQFTVFGQHIHIGCETGDGAIWLAHGLSRYIPHLIALSASSPFFQGVDTAFDSARLHSVTAFPLSGHIPFVADWQAFNEYFENMRGLGVVESMKDFYWDIRPKPEFGTVEIRVCDTPLTLSRAVALATFARALSCWLLTERPFEPAIEVYRVYGYNRFLACRFGLDAQIIDLNTRSKRSLAEDAADTMARVRQYVPDDAGKDALDRLRDDALARRNDARWLREAFAQAGSLSDVVRLCAERWLEK